MADKLGKTVDALADSVAELSTSPAGVSRARGRGAGANGQTRGSPANGRGRGGKAAAAKSAHQTARRPQEGEDESVSGSEGSQSDSDGGQEQGSLRRPAERQAQNPVKGSKSQSSQDKLKSGEGEGASSPRSSPAATSRGRGRSGSARGTPRGRSAAGGARSPAVHSGDDDTATTHTPARNSGARSARTPGSAGQRSRRRDGGGGDDGDGMHGRAPRGQQHSAPTFENYWDRETVSAGLKRGELLRGRVRINKTDFEEAFVPGAGKYSRDVRIPSLILRNRALEGDIVVVAVDPQEEWLVLEKDAAIKGCTAAELCPDHCPPRLAFRNVPMSNAISGIMHALEPISVKRKYVRVTGRDAKTRTCTVTVQFDSEEDAEKALAKENLKVNGQAVHTERLIDPILHVGVVPLDCMQPTGRVVFIEEEVNPRVFSGILRPFQGFEPLITAEQTAADAKGNVLFIARDTRAPRLQIKASTAPVEFLRDPKWADGKLLMARLTKWDISSIFAQGELVQDLGMAGDIEGETQAILLENGVDTNDFTEEELACLPQVPESGWVISEEELAKRRDFRQDCVFSIDPPTARDLDDALSCDQLPNGNYLVGVHIADVSHFLQPGTALDALARRRATTTYLVQRCYPMLPRLLCEDLCSLEENQDRLSFSVVWTMDRDGNIVDEWIGKSVIRSCARLAYQHCQAVIENPDIDWNAAKHPPVFGDHTIDEVKGSIGRLQALAVKLRQKRFQGGALRLDRPKAGFVLGEDGLPTACFQYQLKDSNRLVEEFMLLANMATARAIYNHFNDCALLRCHPPPLDNKMQELQALCESMGIGIDITSSASLQESLLRFAGSHSPQQFLALQAMISQPMQVATYFSTGGGRTIESFCHYALSVPFYTHFTSPIRRYADVIVHRLLDAALRKEPTHYVHEEVQKIADRCNERKSAAKVAQEASADLYTCAYIRRVQPERSQALVYQVMDASFDILVPELALDLRVRVDKLGLRDHRYNAARNSLVLDWPVTEETKQGATLSQTINLFSEVSVRLKVVKNGLRSEVEAELLRPL